MTSVLFLLTGIAVTAIPAAYARGLEAERHHWRLTRLEYLRVDRLYHDCDHYARENRRLRDSTAELREGLGEVLDTVAARDALIDRLTAPPSACPDAEFNAEMRELGRDYAAQAEDAAWDAYYDERDRW